MHSPGFDIKTQDSRPLSEALPAIGFEPDADDAGKDRPPEPSRQKALEVVPSSLPPA